MNAHSWEETPTVAERRVQAHRRWVQPTLPFAPTFALHNTHTSTKQTGAQYHAPRTLLIGLGAAIRLHDRQAKRCGPRHWIACFGDEARTRAQPLHDGARSKKHLTQRIKRQSCQIRTNQQHTVIIDNRN